MSTIAELLVKIGVDVEDADKAEKRVKGLDKTVDRFGDQADRSTRKAQRGFRRLGAGIRNMAVQAKASIASTVESMGGLKGVALVGATAIAALAAATFRFVDSQTSAIDETNKLSAALGINVEELQRLQFAAGQSGLSQEHLKAGMLRLNQALNQLTQGAAGPAKQALDSLGLSLEDLNGLSRTEQLGIIGERLQGIENAAQRSAVAAQIFGEEAGPKMASLLALGSSGLQELAGQAQNVLSQEDADRASAFQDRMGELRSTITGLVQTIAIDLLPTIQEAVIGFRNWINENRALIEQGVSAFIRDVSASLRDLWEVVSLVAEAVNLLASAWDSVTSAIGPADSGLRSISGTFMNMLSPLRMVATYIRDVKKALIEVGAIDAGPITNQFEAVAKAATAKLDAAGLSAPAGAPTFAEYGVPSMLARPTGGGGRGGGGGGGRGGGGGSKKGGKGLVDRALEAFQDLAETAQSRLPGMSSDELIRTLLSGQEIENGIFAKNIQALARKTPSTRDVKPTVAIDFYNFSQTFHVKSTDPHDVGAEVAKATRAEFRKASAKASQGLLSNILR